uniref:NADH-ubiquinone oxidoreductase chain 2 n=1 Tax=Spiniphilus spinicornis TaxID=1799505 RepID=A0A140CVL4_9CUCU|nr:NADH dehydrogenase subunit 2 [Spiniphilus spinicornis]AMJ17338.1 NADH dehydrogenase subunit 2 [Spiniphilus spinicornis]QVM79140.1 NADH dehydrogenase subunit 2 [Spiniphilus spinicornis]
MTKFYKILFGHTLILGTLMSISSYSWFSMWMGLEINLLSMIPLLKDSKNLYPSESALKYFIVQALASAILLFSIILILNSKEYMIVSPPMAMLLNSALLTKLGAAPFHAWFPEVMEGIDWINCLILLTWQKIAPMILLTYNLNMSMFLSYIIIISSLTGSILGLNQISLRKIMAYSSINHIGWMLASMLSSLSVWTIYFLTYSIITFNIVYILHQMNLFTLKQFFNTLNSNKIFKFFFILNFMSLGGLPPFLGFFPKWLTINLLTYNNFMVLSFILILSTLLTLYFYLRITFSSLVINSNEALIFSQKKTSWMMMFLNLVVIMGLMFCTMIMSLF